MRAIVFLVLCLASAITSAEPVVMKMNGITITETDVTYYALDRIPPARRADFFKKDDAVLELAESLFIIRAIAAEASASGVVDEDFLEWQLELHRERLMMEQYLSRLEEVATQDIDWEGTAREAYIAEPVDYSVPERRMVSHILIKNVDRTDEEAKMKAAEVLQKLAAGEDFTQLAIEYSEDPTVQSNSGSLGILVKGQTVPEFEEAAFALSEVGEVAGPVKTQFGYHLIQLNSYQPAKQRSFEEVKDEIVASLKQQIPSKVRQDKVIEIRSAEQVEVNDEVVSALLEKFRSGVFD